MRNQNRNRLATIAFLKLDQSSRSIVNAYWTKYETEIYQSIKTSGKRYTLERYKLCYLFLRNIVLQLPTQPIPWCKVDSDGIPKILWTLRPLIKGDRNDKRIALSIARSYEIIKLPIDYSTRSIKEPPLRGVKFQETHESFKQFLVKFTHKYPWYLGSLHHRNDEFEPIVFTTLSAGPNGPAVACSHLDAKAVINDKSLYSSIKELNIVLKQSWITKWMELQASSFNSKENYLTGRLGFTAEPGGKTRIFAIGDYWSQTSLKVIQSSLYNTLRSISTDATDNQNKGFQDLIKESVGKETYCFDLTAASDRIPAIMQRHRLDLLGGHKLGDAWLSVMRDRTFYIKATKEKVRWTVGQPLGLLSSFPAFALWHHDIIQYAYNTLREQEGKPLAFFKDYRLLGDDVVIYNKKVAGYYQYLMTEVLDVKINLQKSVIGAEGKSQIEFIKRFSIRGLEMSSIKRNILTKNSLVNMLDLVDILIERDFIPNSSDSRYYDLQPLLSSEEEARFNFMFWARSRLNAPFRIRGNTDFEISREAFEIKLKAKRSQNLMEKTTLIDKFLSRNLTLDSYYNQSSLPCSIKALGLESYKNLNSDLELHPLVWAINQTGMDLSIALSTIWDEESPDVAPVEYLPIVSLESYFKSHNTKYHSYKVFLSKIILDVYTELRNETTTT